MDDSAVLRRDVPAKKRPARARIAKRALDVSGALLMLVALAPLLALVAVLIKVNSRGPVLFQQRRLGRDMRLFTLWKFRTMHTGVSSDLHKRYIAELARGGDNGDGLKKLTQDPRVTSVGGVLRRLSVDELPQLFNVVVGDMSLVGPRPALMYELEHYLPYHFERFQVRPGLTGLWQVSGRNELGFREMLDLDVEYARTATFLRDACILARTPRAAISHAA